LKEEQTNGVLTRKLGTEGLKELDALGCREWGETAGAKKSQNPKVALPSKIFYSKKKETMLGSQREGPVGMALQTLVYDDAKSQQQEEFYGGPAKKEEWDKEKAVR